MLVKSDFSRFAEDSFGYTMQSSRCISLLRCTQDIKPHLWGLNVVNASLRSEIQLLWARVGTETNFMLMHRSIRDFNFPSVEIELLKISSSNSNPRGQNYVRMPYPSSFFIFEKGKLEQLTGILLSSVLGEWEIWTSRGWCGESEPEMSRFLKG